MDQHVFISYARADGLEFARKLAKDLASQNINIWLDEVSIPVGSDWDTEIDIGLQSSKAVLLLLTPGAILSHQVKSEWNSALNRHQPLIPLFVKDCDIPRVISVFNYIDFRHNYKKNLENLLKQIARLDSEYPKYLQQLLEAYESAKLDAKEPARFNSKIEFLRQRITDWSSSKDEQSKRIASGIEKQRELMASLASPEVPNGIKTIGRKPIEVTDLFKNRIHHRKQITALLSEKKFRLISVIARGGMGKTALVTKVLLDIELNSKLPDSNIDVQGIVYLSARNGGINLENIFMDSIKLFEPTMEEALNAIWASTKLSTEEKIDNLIESLSNHKYILFIDNIEDILDAAGYLVDNELQTFFDIALRKIQKSKIVITSRNTIRLSPEISAFEKQIIVQEGLPTADGIQLLRELDPNGNCGVSGASDEDLTKLVELGHGVPRALEVMIAILANDPFMSINDLQNNFIYHEDTVKELIAENYKKLDENSQRVLEAIAMYGKPVSILAIDYLLENLFPGLNVPQILRQLSQIRIIDIDRISKTVYLHPLDNDYAYSQIPRAQSTDNSYCLINLENRVADFYAKFHKPSPWSRLDDVQSYIDEFEHRIKAQEYNRASILLSKIANFLSFQGHVLRLGKMITKLEGKLSSDEALSAYFFSVGLMKMVIGPLEEAITNFKNADAKASANSSIKYHIMMHLGDAYRFAGKLDLAVIYLENVALHNFDIENQIHVLMNLSMTYTTLWQLGSAIKYAEIALEKAKHSENVVTLGKAYNASAVAYFAARKDRTAIEHALKSLHYYEESNNKGTKAVNGTTFMLQLLGMCYLGLGDRKTAFEYFNKALANTREYDLPRVRGFVMFNIATAHYINEEIREALEAAKQSQKLFADVGGSHIDVSPLVNVLRSRLDHDKINEAKELLRCAQETLKTPDLFTPLFFAETASKIAGEIHEVDLQGKIQTFINDLKKRY